MHRKTQMSRRTTKPTKWSVCPAKTRISLGICPIWSVFANAQADLINCWAHMPVCWFCREAAQMLLSSPPCRTLFWYHTGCMVPPATITALASSTTLEKCTAGFNSRNFTLHWLNRPENRILLAYTKFWCGVRWNGTVATVIEALASLTTLEKCTAGFNSRNFTLHWLNRLENRTLLAYTKFWCGVGWNGTVATVIERGPCFFDYTGEMYGRVNSRNFTLNWLNRPKK